MGCLCCSETYCCPRATYSMASLMIGGAITFFLVDMCMTAGYFTFTIQANITQVAAYKLPVLVKSGIIGIPMGKGFISSTKPYIFCSENVSSPYNLFKSGLNDILPTVWNGSKQFTVSGVCEPDIMYENNTRFGRFQYLQMYSVLIAASVIVPLVTITIFIFIVKLQQGWWECQCTKCLVAFFYSSFLVLGLTIALPMLIDVNIAAMDLSLLDGSDSKTVSENLTFVNVTVQSSLFQLGVGNGYMSAYNGIKYFCNIENNSGNYYHGKGKIQVTNKIYAWYKPEYVCYESAHSYDFFGVYVLTTVILGILGIVSLVMIILLCKCCDGWFSCVCCTQAMRETFKKKLLLLLYIHKKIEEQQEQQQKEIVQAPTYTDCNDT